MLRTMLVGAVLVMGLAVPVPGEAAQLSAAQLSAAQLPALGQGPAIGLVVRRPEVALETLTRGGSLPAGARLVLAWQAEQGDGSDRWAGEAAALGVIPWVELVLETPGPVADHLAELDDELLRVAALAERMPAGAWLQICWQPPDVTDSAQRAVELAFLLKRASAAIAGANPEAHVVPAALPADEDLISALYDAGIGTYVNALVLTRVRGDESEDALDQALAVVRQRDPGRLVLLQTRAGASGSSDSSCPVGGPAGRGIGPRALAAELAHSVSEGLSGVLLETDEPGPDEVGPVRVLATELAGEVSLDPGLVLDGAAAAWAFVRAEDLGVRLVVVPGGSTESLELEVESAALRNPIRVDPDTGVLDDDVVNQRAPDRLRITIARPRALELIRLERLSAAEMDGFAEEIAVVEQRMPPVEEILRQLQASEAEQERRLEHYTARNTTHLRFRSAETVNAVQVSFEGDLFVDRKRGADWAWESVRLNGVRWPGDSIPEIPLVQPDRAAALPLVIELTQEYRYELRGTAEVDGRQCWVVDFEPAQTSDLAGLHKGRVWIDQELSVRVRSRAYQVGLTGMVSSNEETTFYQPLDAEGRPTAWTADAFVLPTRVVGQQTQAVLDAALLVEKEVLITDIMINGSSFDTKRAAAHASAMTMVRDTDKGLRYLEQRPGSSEREVKEGFETDHTFLLGGVFYDDSVDFPLPLAGIDYFSFNVRDTGAQLNLLFAGLYLDANLAKSDILGSHWEAGVRANGLLLPLGEQQYRDGEKVKEEEIEHAQVSAGVYAARQLGGFARLELGYTLGYERFQRADDTAEDMVVPNDTLTHSLRAELSLQRGGYSLSLAGSRHLRSNWKPWGMPGSADYAPDDDEYTLWRAAAGKTWWMPGFMKLGVEAEYLGGASLDRFSRYDFGSFGNAEVSGYPGGLVRASRASGIHIDYGLNLGEVVQVGVDGDAVWATDSDTGLDNELLAGIGLSGSFIGPWETAINVELGVPVAGPANGAVVRLLFLKQLSWNPFG